MTTALSQLRDTARVADLLLRCAQESLLQQPVRIRQVSEDLDTARRTLRAGLAYSMPRHDPVAVDTDDDEWLSPTCDVSSAVLSAPVACVRALPGSTAAPLVCLEKWNADDLVRAFPSLRRLGLGSYGDLRVRFADDGSLWSSGEQQAALFVQQIVDGVPFELAQAVTVWDEAHLAVFWAWARDPWTGCG